MRARPGLAALIGVLLAGCSASAVYERPAPVDERSRADRASAPPQRPAPPPPVAAPVPEPEPLAAPIPVPAPSAEPQAPRAPAASASAPTTIALAQPPAPTHSAVGGLLAQAAQQVQAGELDQGSASLERALRIEPDNPWIWHQLAVVRLLQKQDAQAAQLAARSNALTADRGLQARNWRVVAQARERLGDREGASNAAARARALGGS